VSERARSVTHDALSRDVAALAGLLLLALLYQGWGLVGGPVFWERDTTLFYYPFTDWLAEQLKQGRLPSWLPTAFGGYPLLADGEVGPLYPLSLLVLPWLPTGPAVVLLRVLHTWLAAGLTYLLLRRLGAGRLGSLLAGLVFAFGSFMVGQLQHENMIRSAVWLPGELLLLEQAFRAGGWARQRWLVAAGLLLGVACLGLHLQAVAMSLLALGLFVAYRLALDPPPGPRAERLALLVWAPACIGLVAVGLSAAQWLPLLELGRTSFRGPGLSYALATTYALAPYNLPALLFPYFFRAPDGLWWSLWAPWETLPYVGIAPLAVAPLVLARPRRPAWYFLGLAVVGLWIALASYAPLNLHELLWRLPGVASLRAPGRFTFLFVFGVAGLAAYGLDALVASSKLGPGSRFGEPDEAAPVVKRAWRPRPSRVGLGPLAACVGAVCVLLAVSLPLIAAILLPRLLADPGYGQQVAEVRYLSLRHESPDLEPYQVYEGFVYSLWPLAPKTLLSLLLLATSGGLLLLAALRPGRRRLSGTALAALAALDLLLFALDYHPRATLGELVRQPPVTQFLQSLQTSEHTFAEPALWRLEPNRLSLARVRELNGYSSLQSQRHWEYVSSVDRTGNTLLDLWNARYYVAPARRTDVAIPPGTGTAFRPYELLASGGAGNPTGRELFQIEPFRTGEVRVLASLANALTIPQGELVAELEVVATDGRRVTLPLRAGLEVAEHAIDRPDVGPISAHRRAVVAQTLPDITATGQSFRSNVYYSAWSLTEPLEVRQVSVRYLFPEGYLRLWGVGLVEPAGPGSVGGRVRSLFADDAARYEHPPLYRDEEAVVYRNAAAFPRAYVVPEALPRRGRTDETAIARLALRPFDPRLQAVLEEGPFDDVPLAAGPRPDAGPDQSPPPAAQIEEPSPDHLLIRARGPGVLVINEAYHRGWRAYLDSRQHEVPVYLANYVSRAVGLPAGEHSVELVFDPLSWRFGCAVSLASLVGASLVLATGFSSRRRAGVETARATRGPTA
jgi:hypothetical protein